MISGLVLRSQQAVLCGVILAVLGGLVLPGCKSGASSGSPLAWMNPFPKLKSPPSQADSADRLAQDQTPSRPKGTSGSARSKESGRRGDTASPTYEQELVRARGLERQGKLVEARAIYERLVASEPERYEAYHRMAVVCDRQRRYREAQALYSQAVRLQPQNAELWNDLGYCLFLQGKLDQAERAMLKALALSPDNARYHNNLGMVYGHQGRYEDALEEFRHGGSEADAYYNLAFVLASRNDDEGAKNCFRLALAVDPTYEPARRALRNFEEARKDPEGLFDNNPIVENGIRWEPYVEEPEPVRSSNPVQAASHQTPATSGRVVPSTRPNTQTELRRARIGWTEEVQSAGQR